MTYAHVPDLSKKIDYSEFTPHQARIMKRLRDPDFERFELRPDFVESYKNTSPPWGFDGLGEFTYMRTYSRLKEDGNNERWHETVGRVVEGVYNMQKRRTLEVGQEWIDYQGEKSAEEMYDRIFNMKFLPPGRGLWAMGSAITEERGIYAALNNCAFVSTENLREDLEKPFTFLMDASMLGVGVGFDNKGAGQNIIQNPDNSVGKLKYQIPDTREGWVKSVGLLLRTYFLGNPDVEFDYSLIRPKGESIKTFGGYSSGPEPLEELHESMRDTLEKRIKHPISVSDITDLQNLIGKAVVAGNVRRTAEIAFGEPDDEEFLNLKNPNLYLDELKHHRWASNNSIFARLGMDYSKVAELTRMNGEPGYAWLENMKNFGRMKDGFNPNADPRVKGGNPCLEQSLESYELCCLVETFPTKHENLDDFLRTLKFAYMYAKTVTLGETHWPETNKVMGRNRRIGTSMSGLAMFKRDKGVDALKEWSNRGYDEINKWDEIYSDWFNVPKSIKKTSIKPSGSVSLMPGVTPGIHEDHSEYYERGILVAKNSKLIPALKKANYPIEESVYDKTSYFVKFPIHNPGMRKKEEVSMWEQLEMASFMQEHWADNQVSATITFDPETEGHQIADALNYFQYKLKGVSMLPLSNHGYEQAPYKEITKKDYEVLKSQIGKLDFSGVHGEIADIEKFCDGGAGSSCEVKLPK